MWETRPQTLIDRGVPRGYCGLCSICEKPGHIRHYPGSVPVTGCWCDEHYAALASGFNPIHFVVHVLLIALILAMSWLVFSWIL